MGTPKIKQANGNQKVNAEFSIPVIAREKSTKDSNGKSIKGEILGESKVYQYTSNQSGLASYLKRYDIKSLVSLINRQLKTDVRNELAATAKAPEKGIKTKCKVMIDMIKTNESLRPIFITEVGKWDHVDKDSREAIITVLKSA